MSWNGSGECSTHWYPDSRKDKDVNFIDAMKKHGYDCEVVTKMEECTCGECPDDHAVLITLWRRNKRDEGKNPWTDLSFSSFHPGGTDRDSDIHAIAKDHHTGGEWIQIPSGEAGTQKYNYKIKLSLFENNPLLCCCPRKGEPFDETGSSYGKKWSDDYKVVDE